MTDRKPRKVGAVRRALVLGMLAGSASVSLGVIAIGAAVAQSQKPSSPPAARTPEEQEAMKMLDEEKLVSARRAAEEILAKNPRSMVANYVLGRVYHDAEGSLAQAMYRLGKAREIYEQTWAPSPRPPDAPWEFHRQLLFSIQNVAGEMEEYDYQLEILEYHDALYHPDLTAERAWPLLHLGRVQEARQFAQEAAAAKDPQQRSLGLNTQCAIEGEAGKRDEYYQACKAALDNAREIEKARTGVDEKHESTLAVHAFNAAMAARAAFHIDEAEQMALEGTRRLAFTPANPWEFLVSLYTDQGRMKDAIDALREMQRWRTRQPPNVRDQVRAETDVTFATVLLVAAETDTALRSVDLALAAPDRRGMVSSTPAQALGAHALLRRVLLRTHAELERERASTLGVTDRVKAKTRQWQADFESKVDDERVIGVLGDSKRLVATLRPFTRGGIEPMPPWLVGELVDVLGAGVVAVALREARRADPMPEAAPYFDALEAEIAFVRGDGRQAVKLANRALAGLPKNEVLLRARVAAVAAQAARDAGQLNQSAALFEQAMQLDPSVIRRLGLAIPARVTVQGGSALARRVGEMLDGSPRLHTGEKGFQVSVEAGGSGPGGLQICLRGPTGAMLSCAQTLPEDQPDASEGKMGTPDAAKKRPKKLTLDEQAALLVDAFHKQALAMPLGLTGTDLSSLDGSTTVAEQAVRQRLKGVLDEVTNPKPGGP